MTAAARAPQLPPPARVQAALRAVTERLATEVTQPQASAPDWSEFEWRTARAVAAMHGISGLLTSVLVWHGPAGWADFLSEQRAHIARRNLRMRELLMAVGNGFLSRGIPVQALKGAALHRDGLYRAGERPMADLDLLVLPQHAEAASGVLQSLGLHESHRTLKHRVFVPRHAARRPSFGEHADNDMKVELHERICEPLPLRLTDISHVIWSREAHPGLNPYPSRAALMAHLLLHAGGGMAWRTLRLIQLHDIALLARCLTQQDWQALQSGAAWWAWPPLALAERYYGTLAPRALMATLRANCQPILRRACRDQCLSDVSLSRLWLEAFPGIEWARSLGEALRYMGRRTLPGAAVLADRKVALQTDPSLAEGDWGDLSQGRRIMRALKRRTARPWPLYNVRAALAQSR
jgi:hypothetical protein